MSVEFVKVVRARFATEMFELLAKCHVEDRSHHTRVLSIDTMFKVIEG